MILTNDLNLPDSIVRAVANDPYTQGEADISVTTLIGPARKRALQVRHGDMIQVDAADRLWALYGQIVHSILERATLGDDQIVTEQRLFIKRQGWTISGQFDQLILKDKVTMQDYKFTSAYTVANGVKPEHEAQANIYRLMLEDNNYKIDALEIVAILRDWSKTKAANDSRYPQKPVVIMPIDLWPLQRTENYITARLIAHGLAQTTLPECTAEERWERGTVWKVYKGKNKRAVPGHASHETEDEATAAAEELATRTDHHHRIEFHQGASLRCQHYCGVSAFCDQWKQNNPNRLNI